LKVKEDEFYTPTNKQLTNTINKHCNSINKPNTNTISKPIINNIYKHNEQNQQIQQKELNKSLFEKFQSFMKPKQEEDITNTNANTKKINLDDLRSSSKINNKSFSSKSISSKSNFDNISIPIQQNNAFKSTNDNNEFNFSDLSSLIQKSQQFQTLNSSKNTNSELKEYINSLTNKNNLERSKESKKIEEIQEQ